MGELCYTFVVQDKNKIESEIASLESEMQSVDFWQNKSRAQEVIKKIQDLKNELLGAEAYDKGNAIVTLFAGAGGDDAEDFAHMLFVMYSKYAARKGFGVSILHENENDHGGIRNLTFEVEGKNAYGILKRESGVHRLVRVSPFNAKSLRHTSFALVEVIPRFEKTMNVEIPPEEVRVEFARAGGPGGQNVNKRETAVRIVHIPTNISVHCTSERSQAQNRERAMEILKGKLYALREQEREAKQSGMYISKTADIEWGNQIRSYVLHPYKMIKDHRTDYEENNVDKVLEEGDLDGFIEAEKNL